MQLSKYRNKQLKPGRWKRTETLTLIQKNVGYARSVSAIWVSNASWQWVPKDAIMIQRFWWQHGQWITDCWRKASADASWNDSQKWLKNEKVTLGWKSKYWSRKEKDVIIGYKYCKLTQIIDMVCSSDQTSKRRLRRNCRSISNWPIRSGVGTRVPCWDYRSNHWMHGIRCE